MKQKLLGAALALALSCFPLLRKPKPGREREQRSRRGDAEHERFIGAVAQLIRDGRLELEQQVR